MLVIAALIVAVVTFAIVLGVHRQQILHDAAAQQALANVHEGMLDQEDGLRGYLLTGDPRYLEPYRRGQSALAQGNGELASLVGDDSTLAGALTATNGAENDWVTKWARVASTGSTGGIPTGAFLDQGKQLFERYRTAEGQLSNQLAIRMAGARDSERDVLIFGVVGEIIVFVVMLVVGRREYETVEAAVLEPVAQLVMAIGQLGRGELETPIPHAGPGELQQIGGQLRAMAQALATKQEELEHQTAELRQAQQAAEAASQAKSEFLSRVSHELRTPLTAIIGFAELLEDDRLTPSQEEFVGTILRAGNHLLDLINDVLDISRIESGRMALSLERIDTAGLIEESIGVVRPLADGRGMPIELEGADSPDIEVLADHQRLRQILLNLLSNAIKFSPADTPVRIAVATRGRRVRITVADQGPGIGSDDQAKLFSPFERLNAAERGVEGTGLGLALCRSLAEAMGGILGVQSSVGEGSRFWVELNRTSDGDPVHQRGILVPADDVVPDYGGKRRVLYIEDTPSNVRLVQEIVARRPCVELMVATRADSGIIMARTELPDLILLDLHLPDMEGGEVMRELQADASTAAIPVVVLSADATPPQIERLLSAGAQAYLTKPIRKARLLATLDGILSVQAPQRI